PEEKPGALLLIDDAGVLSHPADTREASEGSFDNGPGVNKDPGLDAWRQRFQSRAKLFEFCPHYLVVILPPGVARNPGARRDAGGNWKLQTGNGRLDIGNWKIDTGDLKL